MIHEIQKEIWLETPRGLALAQFIWECGPESSIKWGCFLNDSGQIWWYENEQVRAAKNITIGRTNPEKPPKNSC